MTPALAIVEQLGSPLMQRALLVAVLVGAVAGAVGTHVVLRRRSFFGTAMAHATFPGVVLADLAGVGVLLGGLAFAWVLVALLLLLGAERRLDGSTAVGVALAGSFGLGVVLQSLHDSPTRSLAEVLVGSVVTVSRGDVVGTALVGALVVGALLVLHKDLVLTAFDPQGAEAMGYGRGLEAAFLLLVATAVVAVVPAVGSILAVALLAVPALTARLWADRVGPTMALAAALGAVAGVLGLAASAEWRLAGGASIALASAVLFAGSLVLAPHGPLRARSS